MAGVKVTSKEVVFCAVIELEGIEKFIDFMDKYLAVAVVGVRGDDYEVVAGELDFDNGILEGFVVSGRGIVNYFVRYVISDKDGGASSSGVISTIVADEIKSLVFNFVSPVEFGFANEDDVQEVFFRKFQKVVSLAQ